jgi:L-aspartate oxidase
MALIAKSDAVSLARATAPPDAVREAATIVVGGGAAGLMAALCASSGGQVILVTKEPLLCSASSLAQAGIAAAIGADDSPALHASDTLAAGRGLCSPHAVAALVEDAPARIRDLEELGVEFDDALALEGGHSRRRVASAGGMSTGDRVARVLAQRVIEHPRIEVFENVAFRGLRLLHGRVVGADTSVGRLRARATILATGGLTGLWARNTNPWAATGDGILAAYQAGAAIADLELVQFHPTTLDGTSVMLSEGLRGEGATLLDCNGSRFTDELAPRDVVARAIATRERVALDLRGIDRSRFPRLMRTISEHGFDPGQQPVPVSPAAHYSIGGIVTDLDGRTELRSLFAAGECAATGVHGANRLASNSLLECLVFGRRAALAALEEPALSGRLAATVPVVDEPVTESLREEMWKSCGLFRDAEPLRRLARRTHPLARLVAESAGLRAESRGCHFRTDHPAESPFFARHVVLRRGLEPAFQSWA